MISIPVNPNSVYIPTVQTGCLKAEFDSTYPIHLNGIISQDEFRESINRINRTIGSRRNLIILMVIFILSIIAGMIFFIVGGMTAVNSRTYGFPPLIGVGIGITLGGFVASIIGCCILQSGRVARMQQVISEESRKYSSKLPTPCSWRLDCTRQCVGGYGNDHNSQLVYHLVIDIGRSNAPENGKHYSNQVAPQESTVLFGRQDDSAPPPYHDQATGFCSQCGAPRQGVTAKFCSTCGHSFNKY